MNNGGEKKDSTVDKRERQRLATAKHRAEQSPERHERTKLLKRLRAKVRRRTFTEEGNEIELYDSMLIRSSSRQYEQETDEQTKIRREKDRLRKSTPKAKAKAKAARAAQQASESITARNKRLEKDRLRHGLRYSFTGEKFREAQDRLTELETFSRTGENTWKVETAEERSQRLDKKKAYNQARAAEKTEQKRRQAEMESIQKCEDDLQRRLTKMWNGVPTISRFCCISS